MKKIFTIISLVGVTTLLQAQGFIQYNGGAANIQTNSVVFSGGQTVAGTGTGKTSAASTGLVINYALLYETTALVGSTAPTNSAWALVTQANAAALGATNSAAPGGMGGTSGAAGVAVNLPAGVAATVELVGWSAGLGTWAQVLTSLSTGSWNPNGGYFGYTTVASMTPFATQGAGDPLLFPTVWANGTFVLNIVPVPEPSTMVLAGLGGLSLLLFRRRK